MAFNYVVTSQKPTAIQTAVVCSFTSRTDQNLILARGNRLEIHTLSADGLIPVFDVGIYGRIISMSAFRPPTVVQDVLFVLTERYFFSVLSFDSNTKKLDTRATGNLRDKVGRDLESGPIGLIDPDNRVIGVFLYEGVMKIIPILNSGNGLGDPFNVRIEELKFIDVKFLYGCPRPTLCVLYEDSRNCRHVKTYVIDVRDKELETGPWMQGNVEHSAKMIIPIPIPSGGIVLVGQSTLTYLSGTGKYQAITIQHGSICSYGLIDADGSRYLLGDAHGSLLLLSLHKEHNQMSGLSIDILGSTSIATALCYLDNGIVFVASHCGDSQLIKLLEAQDNSGSHLEILQAYMNIGPIVDMCVVASERQGQSQVITCSGAHKDGSLRVIRSGIGIEEQAALELQGIKGLWSLRQGHAEEYDRYLVQAFIGETRVLAIEQDQLVETEIPGFSIEQTLFCCNLCADLLLQVTPSVARLVSTSTSGFVSDAKFAPKRVTGATATFDQVVLSLSGGELLYMEVDFDDVKGSHVLQPIGNVLMDHDIACMSMRSITDSESSSANTGGSEAMAVDGNASSGKVELHSSARSRLLAVALWTDLSVRLLALPTLQEVGRTSLGVETQARDLLLVDMETVQPMLLVGLGDGTLLIYSVEQSSGLPSLSARRKIALGSQPISLSCFLHNDHLCVFASCDRPTVLYSKNGKLLFSIANVSEVTGMTPFHTEAFPDCLALSSEFGLRVGTVDDIQKIHVQTYHLGESPRRICHSAKAGVYAVCTQKTVSVAEQGEETVERVLFLDEGTMQQIHVFELDPMEMAISCCCFSLRLSADSDATNEVLIVGTAFSIEEYEPTKGRLLVFDLDLDRRVRLLTQRDVKGSVYTIATLDGKILAGIGSKVQLFKWVPHEDALSAPELQPETSYKGCILALYIKTHGDFVVVGDLMRSVTLLHYRSVDGSLEEVARDYNANYMRAVEALDDDHYLGCEDLGNIFVLRRQAEASNEEERSRLELHAEMHLGDCVNVIRHGSLNSQPADTVDLSSFMGIGQSSVLFGTVCGSLGSILSLPEPAFRFFTAVERAVSLVVTGVGGLTHSDWRSFFNGRRHSPQRNFIDGDMVELFLELSEADMAQALKHVNDDLAGAVMASSTSSGALMGPVTVEEVVKRVEEISRLH